MKSRSCKASQLLVFTAVASLIPLCLSIETVSIEFTKQHACISSCLIMSDPFYGKTDIASAMGCKAPLDNSCYCATATESVAKASSWMDKCASSACGSGDLTQDINSMHVIYASYCVRAGLTQPGATELLAQLTSSAGITTSPPVTTTELTLVTKTSAPVNSGGKSPTPPQVTVKTTSTVWADANGNFIPNPVPNDSASTSNLSQKLGIGLGVGLGVPIIAVVVFGIWFCWRKKRSTVPRTVTAQVKPGRPLFEKDLDQKPELDVTVTHSSAVGRAHELPVVRNQDNIAVNNVINPEGLAQELPSTEWRPELSSSPSPRYIYHR